MRRTRRAGFTLVELIVYLALVTGGLTVVIGLELAASRASFLERALIDLALRGDDLGTRFRDDLRQATHVVLPPIATADKRPHGAIAILQLASGEEARYEIEDSAKVETTSDAEHATQGLRASDVRLVRLLLPKPGAADARERTVYGGIERLTLQRQLRAPRALYSLEVALAYARGGEITARRTFRYSASPIAEEAP